MSVSRWLYSLVVSVAVCSVSRAAVPLAYLLNNFDTPAEASTWAQWPNWGDTSVSITFDPTMNNGGAAGSGSMKVSANFSTPDSNSGLAIARFFSGTFFDESVSLPVSAFSDLSMDLRWDPASAPDGFGTFPLLYSGFNTPEGGLVTSTAYATPVSDTGWTHVSFSVPNTSSGQISGFFFYMFDGYSPGDVNYYAGTETFWIDNVQLTYVPEPSVTILFSGGAFVFGLVCTVGRRKRV
jgi:hypothetical protein